MMSAWRTVLEQPGQRLRIHDSHAISCCASDEYMSFVSRPSHVYRAQLSA